jgi:hypothetical protein
MSCNNNRGSTGNERFIAHISRFIGEEVLIFTTSGGPSGLGFSGVLLSVNCDFVRLLSQQGSSPTCPISDICMDQSIGDTSMYRHSGFRTGSVCDIPIDRIATFTHNAI